MAKKTQPKEKVHGCHAHSKHVTKLRAEMLEFLHRKPSECGLDVAQLKAEATARLKKVRFEKDEYTPPKPADWVTAFHTGKQVINEQPKGKAIRKPRRTKPTQVKQVGHKSINKRLRWAQKNLQFFYDQMYADRNNVIEK